MEHKMIAQRVKEFFKTLVFDEASHTYINKGKNLTPVSTMIKEFVKPFDSEKIAEWSAKKQKKKKEDLLKEWEDIKNEACEAGTRVHDFGERHCIDKYSILTDLRFHSPEQHLKKDEQLNAKEIALVNFWDKKPDYYIPILMELRMFSEELGIAGTADIILLDTRDNTLVIGDYKTNKDLFKQYKDQKLLGIFSDMDDTPYSKYKLQLSFYQILLELTGYKVSRRFLVWLKEDAEYEVFDTSDITDRINNYFKSKKQYQIW